MTVLPCLMFILAFISTFQWPNSAAQHTYILHKNNLPQGSSTKNHTESTNLVNQDNRTTTTTSSYKEDQKNDPDTGMKNMRDVVLLTAHLMNLSSIVFPISTDEKIKINKFIPEQSEIEKCSLNETFCIKVDNYPREDLYKIFRDSKFMSTSYYDIDAMNEINDFETRISSGVRLESFCQSRIEVIYPEAGLTSKNEWRYIVQTPEINDNGTFIKQGVLVEKCMDVRAPCRFYNTLPIGYVSTCIQKYIYKRLISIEGPNNFYYDNFRIPSCCQCMYTINEDMITRKSGD